MASRKSNKASAPQGAVPEPQAEATEQTASISEAPAQAEAAAAAQEPPALPAFFVPAEETRFSLRGVLVTCHKGQRVTDPDLIRELVNMGAASL